MSYPVPANINDQIAFLPDTSYVIPARLVKQLVEAAQPTPKPSARDTLIAFLEAAGIEYRWEERICVDNGISHVWFGCKEGWELVFEFDADSGDYKDLYIEG